MEEGKRKKAFSNLPLLNPKRISFYFQAKGDPQWQNKRTQVLRFSHYEMEGGMRREQLYSPFPFFYWSLIHLTGLLISILPHHFSLRCLTATSPSYIIVALLNECWTTNKSQTPNKTAETNVHLANIRHRGEERVQSGQRKQTTLHNSVLMHGEATKVNKTDRLTTERYFSEGPGILACMDATRH